MRILVFIEPIYDPKTVKISRSREELDLREAVLVTHPADKCALEAALRLAVGGGGEVIALAIGGAPADDAVREAIAMGADRGVLIQAEAPVAAPAATALIVAALERLGGVDLVITGEPDLLAGGAGLGPRVAAALGWPLILDAIQLEPHEDGVAALALADDGGIRLEAACPAVVTVGRRAARPRYPHPTRIANAWQEGWVETWSTADLRVGAELLTPDCEPGGLALGPERARGQVLTGDLIEATATLVAALRGQRLI